MGKFNGKDATVWMRAIKPHTYEQKPQDEGSIYLAHEEMVETIEILGFARREPAPAKAVRPSETGPPIPRDTPSDAAPDASGDTQGQPSPATPVGKPSRRRQ